MADDDAEVREESPVKFRIWQTPTASAPEKEQRCKAWSVERELNEIYRERLRKGQ
jgi:hypothetical protein